MEDTSRKNAKLVRARLRRLASIAVFALGLTGAAAFAQRPVLISVNQGDHDISIIDPVAGHEVATVTLDGITGHEAALSPDGRTAYVPIYGDAGVGKAGSDGNKIDVIDIPSRKLTGTIQFVHGVRPHCIIFDARTGLLYVTTELDQAITLIDPKTLKIVGTIPTGQAQSHMLALSHDGRFGYTANVGPGTVSVLDMKARKTKAIVPISPNTQRISISNDDRYVFTADQTQPRLAVIDTATDKVASWISLPGIAYGTAPTRDGRWLLVALRTIDKVALVDLRTLKVDRVIDTPAQPTEILARPDGKIAYVSCPGAGKVAVVDLASFRVASVIDAGKFADGLAWGGDAATLIH